ncbi:hypothetical protein COLU111180_04185 [Cohnella lubricantis]|nr:hypothetical protein [Cohnella lubricantis]
MGEQYIYVVDPPGSTGEKCECGKDAAFLIGICGHEIHACETCIAELGKSIIDALV